MLHTAPFLMLRTSYSLVLKLSRTINRIILFVCALCMHDEAVHVNGVQRYILLQFITIYLQLNFQVEQHIFIETNKMKKSIQVMLDVLNELRLCHVLERANTSSTPNKQENLKVNTAFCVFFS